MFVLAEKIGGRTVEELASVLSLSEFAEWAEHIRLENKAVERGPSKVSSKRSGKIGRKR